MTQIEEIEAFLNSRLYSYLKSHPNCTLQDVNEILSETDGNFSYSSILKELKELKIKERYFYERKSAWKKVWFGFFEKSTPSETELLAKETREKNASLKRLSRIN